MNEQWYLRLTRDGPDVEVGPFDSPDAAYAWVAEWRVPGVWSAHPLQRPDGPPDWNWKGPQ